MTELFQRADFRESASHPLVRALNRLVTEHGLAGAVLISFNGERVGVNASSPSEVFGKHMIDLGDKILVAIADGQFDPEG